MQDGGIRGPCTVPETSLHQTCLSVFQMASFPATFHIFKALYIYFIWGLNLFIVPSGPDILPKCLTEKTTSKAQYLQYLPTETTGSCQHSTNLKETSHSEFIASEEVSSCFEFLYSLLLELWLFCPYSCLSAVLWQRAIPLILILYSVSWENFKHII